MAISNQQSEPITVIKILLEGLKLPAKNYKLILPIFFLSLLFSSLFYIFTYLSLTYLLITQYPDSILNHLTELCIIVILSLIVSFVIRSLLTITTIHLLSTAYSNNNTPTTLKDALSILNPSSIKGSMITILYIGLFQLGCVLILVLSIVVVLRFLNTYSEQKMIILVIAVIVAVVLLRWYLYLIIVWGMSLVISVVNEGCYGMDGIMKAGELLRGRRWQAIRIVSMETFVCGLIYEAYNLAIIGYVPPSIMGGLAFGVGQMFIFEASSLFLWSVYTVYYHECKKIQEKEIVIDGSLMYVAVPTHADDAYP